MDIIEHQVDLWIPLLTLTANFSHFRNRNKSEAFDWKHFLVLFIKIVCDASFRLTIFGAWMYTINAGVFSTWITFGYYYIIVLAMIVLNILFSWRDGDMIHCLSLRNGLGIYLLESIIN